MHRYSQKGLEFFLDEALRNKSFFEFEKLSQLVRPPIHLFNHKLKISHHAFLRLVYALRLLIPSFLLYEQCRGERGAKVIALIAKVLPFYQ